MKDENEIKLLKKLENEPKQILVDSITWKKLIELLDNHRINILENRSRIKELEKLKEGFG